MACSAFFPKECLQRLSTREEFSCHVVRFEIRLVLDTTLTENTWQGVCFCGETKETMS